MIKRNNFKVYSGAEYSNLPLEMYVLYLILLCGLKAHATELHNCEIAIQSLVGLNQCKVYTGE